MLDKIVNDGRKLITIIDPHCKVDSDYWMYQDSQKLDLAVKDSNK